MNYQITVCQRNDAPPADINNETIEEEAQTRVEVTTKSYTVPTYAEILDVLRGELENNKDNNKLKSLGLVIKPIAQKIKKTRKKKTKYLTPEQKINEEKKEMNRENVQLMEQYPPAAPVPCSKPANFQDFLKTFVKPA
jgi:hypothetical protein